MTSVRSARVIAQRHIAAHPTLPFFLRGRRSCRGLRSPVTLPLETGQRTNSTLSVRRPIELVVLNLLASPRTNDTASGVRRVSTSLAKSASERGQFGRPCRRPRCRSGRPRISPSRSCSAGRSILPPEKPANRRSGFLANTQPSSRWAANVGLGRLHTCAASELNSCSSPSSEDLRV